MAGRKRLLSTTARQRAAGEKRKKKEKPKDFDDMIQRIVDEGASKFIYELMSLSGKEYVDRYSQLIEYVKPKLSRVEKTGDTEERSVTINMISSGSDAAMLLLESRKEQTEDIDFIEA